MTNSELDKANAILGAKKQVRMWMLIFDGKPIEAAIEQESYWKGGNKNELVTCVGTKDGKVTWCYVFSWTTREDLKISVRDRISSMDTFDVDKAVMVIVEEVEAKWERKQFSEFAYLSVPIDTKWMVIIYLGTFLVSVGIFAYSINNGIDEDSGRYWSSNRKRWW